MTLYEISFLIRRSRSLFRPNYLYFCFFLLLLVDLLIDLLLSFIINVSQVKRYVIVFTEIPFSEYFRHTVTLHSFMILDKS